MLQNTEPIRLKYSDNLTFSIIEPCFNCGMFAHYEVKKLGDEYGYPMYTICQQCLDRLLEEYSDEDKEKFQSHWRRLDQSPYYQRKYIECVSILNDFNREKDTNTGNS